MKLSEIIIATILLTLLFLGGFLCGKSCTTERIITTTDTLTVTDTLTIREPVYIEKETVRTELLAVTDTIRLHDTLYIHIPIESKHYTDSTNYDAWISGYNASLDSIRVYPSTVYITTSTTTKPKRWGIGVQAGCGITTQGLSPYIGIGISYNLLRF